MLKKEKPTELEKIKSLVEGYSAVGIINMHSMPGRQLSEIREKLRGKAIIRMGKASIIRMALEQSKKKNMEGMLQYVRGEAALLLTNENPFLIYKFLKNNRSPASAKTGQIAPKDIVIVKGPTPLPPGPAISSLQKLALKTTVRGGKIAIAQDKLVAKAGETITADMISVFSLLKIEPMEIGLNMTAAWENQFVFIKDILDIDVDAVLAKLVAAAQHAVALSLATGYITKETATLAITKAFMEAKHLALHANIVSAETIGDIMANAVAEARALEGILNMEPKQNVQNNSEEVKS